MKRSRAARAWWFAAWSVPIGLYAFSIRTIPEREARGTVLERLVGPLARIAAGVQWARFDRALRDGREEIAYERARSALALAPGDAAGWCFFAHHLVFERGSPSRESDRAARSRWVRAGLEVLDRGEARAQDAGAVAFERGIVGLSLARLDDEDRAWPANRDDAWRMAAESFERAAAHGVPVAAEAARAARAEIEK